MRGYGEDEESAVGQAGSSTRPSRAKPNRAESCAVFGPSSQLRVSLPFVSLYIFLSLSLPTSSSILSLSLQTAFLSLSPSQPFFPKPLCITTPDSFFPPRLGFPVSANQRHTSWPDRGPLKARRATAANGPANGRTIIPGVPRGSFRLRSVESIVWKALSQPDRVSLRQFGFQRETRHRGYGAAVYQ